MIISQNVCVCVCVEGILDYNFLKVIVVATPLIALYLFTRTHFNTKQLSAYILSIYVFPGNITNNLDITRTKY